MSASISTITISMDSDLLAAVREYCEEKRFRIGSYLRSHIEPSLLDDEEFGDFLTGYESRRREA